MNSKEKTKVKIKKKGNGLTPVTLTIVSLGVFAIMLSVGIYPQLMSNSVTKNAYTIRYDSNGGMGSMKEQVAGSNEIVQLKTNKFKKDGYTFVGWYAYRSDGMWDCYVNTDKSLTSWTTESYCKKYGYSLYSDEVYVKDIVSSGMQVTMFAAWEKN